MAAEQQLLKSLIYRSITEPGFPLSSLATHPVGYQRKWCTSLWYALLCPPPPKKKRSTHWVKLDSIPFLPQHTQFWDKRGQVHLFSQREGE